jgi:ribose 5-phosphate isomerase B
MRIAVGSDHAGFILKEILKQHLGAGGIDVEDFGAFDRDSVDYPDFAVEVATAVSEGRCTYGVLVCSTGVGMCVAANKVKGIRAALAYNPEVAEQSRAHVDCNVIVFGEKYMDPDSAVVMLDRWLETPFEGGRHERRVNKIKELER